LRQHRNLLLARAASRKKEMAVRAALGASRFRLIRQLLTESVAAGGRGWGWWNLLATWGVAASATIIPSSFPRREGIAIDYWVLGFTAAHFRCDRALFGLAPALQSARTDLTEALKKAARRSRSAPRNRCAVVGDCRNRVGPVLLIGRGLMIQSFLRLQHVNPGFRTDHVLTTELSLPPARYPPAQRTAFSSN